MQRYEFRVIPAPRRGEKARGVKTTEDRFALALTGLMNDLGAEGWDYVRADALPCDERAGLTGTRTTYQNMLVFRRPLPDPAAVPAAQPPVASPVLAAPVAVEAAAPLAASREEAPTSAPAAALAPAPLRLGAADAPAGPAPALGPAKPDVAAE